MFNLFIDSNTWLDLYAFSNNDLNTFSILKNKIGKEIKLIITDQVKAEVYRNRENKIQATLNNFKLINISFPNLCHGYTEYEELYKAYDAFRNKQNDILKIIKNDIANKNLMADKVINDYFDLATSISIEDKHLQMAKDRFEIGNPPGKGKSYGDAINWVILLDKMPESKDLFFISGDKDYKSLFNDEELNPFLKNEWVTKKKSNIFFYPNLPTFIKNNAKDIQLQNENRKLKLIQDFSQSSSFYNTHLFITKLNQESDWTDEQINLLFKAAVDNDQIGSLVCDNDVGNFYRYLYSMAKEKLNNIPEYADFIKQL